LNKKLVGSVVITGMLAAGLTGCTTNQQARNQQNMQRVQYQTQNETGRNIDGTRSGNYTISGNERIGGYRNNTGNMRVGQGYNINQNNLGNDQNDVIPNKIGNDQYYNNNTGAAPNLGGTTGLNDRNYNGFGDIRNDFGLRNNANNTQNAPQITLSGNTLTVPKESVVSRNNVNYIDITRYCNLSSTEEQLNARKINYGRVSTNNTAGQYAPVPMGSINLPGCTSFVEFDAKNPNLMYVKDAPTDNTTVSKPINLTNNEAIKIENGRVLCPQSTLQKIVGQKTVTNTGSLKVNIGQ
jgi:hypothetical protein